MLRGIGRDTGKASILVGAAGHASECRDVAAVHLTASAKVEEVVNREHTISMGAAVSLATLSLERPIV